MRAECVRTHSRCTRSRHSAPASVAVVTRWTGQAHLLADAIREPGFDAAAVNASAWAAGVNPDATAGLIGAATALTSGDCGPQLWAQADPCPSDQALLAVAAELEGAVTDLLKHASALARDCRAALEDATGQAERAHAAAASAPAPQARAARTALFAARAVIADCEAALEVLDDAGRRLEHAVTCLRRVPDDLASTYDQPYAHVRDGGELPFSGDFLTGGIVTAGPADGALVTLARPREAGRKTCGATCSSHGPVRGATCTTHHPPLVCSDPAGHGATLHFDASRCHAFGPEDAD
jgi:hypothetical protein